MPLRNFTVQSAMLADEANNTGPPVVLGPRLLLHSMTPLIYQQLDRKLGKPCTEHIQYVRLRFVSV